MSNDVAPAEGQEFMTQDGPKVTSYKYLDVPGS